jgi:hypothetical protein
MKHVSTLAAPAILTAAVLALTGCGSSAKDAKSTSSSTGAAASTTRSSASTSTSSTPATSTTPLSAIVLQAADVPTTFKKGAPNPDDPADQAAIVACAGGANTASDKLDSAESSFDQGDNSISSSVSRFKSDASTATDVQLLKNPKFDSCSEQRARSTLAKGLPAGAKIGDITMKTTPGTNGGPENVAAIGRGTVTLTANGQTVKIYTVVAYITGPRLESEVDVTGFGAPIDETVAEKAITAVAQRTAKG